MKEMNSVLIVDDIKANIDALRVILEPTYIVYAATNGENAIKIMDKMNPDLVLLDLNMPGMDGFEVIKRIKSYDIFRNVPVIFITGEADPYNEASGLDLGAADYIKKPYDDKIVSIKVRNHLENKMYKDHLESLVDQRTEELKNSQQAIIMGMSMLAEGRDNGTGAHLKRMQKYTELLAAHLVNTHPEILDKKHAELIVSLAPLHDIGKVCIPDSILLKKGKLTDEEFEVIKSHTVFGADILRKTEQFMHTATKTLDVAVEIAESHHEKFCGGGYPNGISGFDIPLSARIVTIADIYDALTSIRDYKKPFSHQTAKDIILKGDGRTMPEHFDPVVLKAFGEVADTFEDIV